MAEIEDFQTDAANGAEVAQSGLLPWQQLLFPWQWPIAFGPFVLLVVVAQFPISNAVPTGVFVGLIITAGVWAVAFKGYLLYLDYQKS